MQRARLSAILSLAIVATLAVQGHDVPPVAASAPAPIEEFAVPDPPYAFPEDVVAGPDGRMWFTEGRNRVGAITVAGAITEYLLPATATDITVGADGALWVTASPGIVRVSTAGSITSFPAPAGVHPTAIAHGPDGRLWFVDGVDKIGAMTTAGTYESFAVAAGAHTPSEIVAGPDGAMWTSSHGGLGRITTAGAATFFPSEPGESPWFGLAVGADGALWYGRSDGIGRSTTDGDVTVFATPSAAFNVGAITAGPDGNLWFVGEKGVATSTTSGVITQFGSTYGAGIAAGPDGALWFSRPNQNRIARIDATLDPSGEYTALTPARLLDTRSGLGNPGGVGPIGAQSSVDLQVLGRGGVPDDGVMAVVLNVTVTEPTAPGYLTVWPAGSVRPTVSTVNFVPGQTLANAATAVVGSGGEVSIFNHAGTAHVVIDVLGFYSDEGGPPGSRFHANTPERLFDTRDGWGGVPAVPVGPQGTLTYDVGSLFDPALEATAVIVNVTATQPTAGGFVTVHPADAPRPTASNLNFTPGLTIPNLVAVAIPPSGLISFFNHAGTTHLVVDLVGFYEASTTTTESGRFHPLAPFRLVDSRNNGIPVGPQEEALVGAALASPEIPDAGVGSLVVNLTATDPTKGGFLTLFSDDECFVPLASNVNFVAGQTAANMAIAPMSSSSPCSGEPGWLALYNHDGFTDYVIDVAGYFTR